MEIRIKSNNRRRIELNETQTEINARLGAYLRFAREQAGISQQALSLQIGRGPKFIWRLENGYSEADLFEFVEIMEELRLDPAEAMKELLNPTNGAQGRKAIWNRVPYA